MSSWPVALTGDLPTGRAQRAMVQGQDLVVWRSASGKLSAWDNRCPHRGMALSHGSVRGEQLACLYHGWHYDCQSAACAYIPAHPDLTPPETIRARAFSVVEDGGVIWVSLDVEASAQVNTRGLLPVRSLLIRAEPGAVEAAAGELFGQHCLLLNPWGEHQTLVHLLAASGSTLEQLQGLAERCDQLRQLAEQGGKAA